MADFIKLSSLVGSEFSVQRVLGFKFKAWDATNKKMLVSDKWEKGYRKMYQVETNKGQLDLSAGQIGNMLEGINQYGKADVIGRTFSVKSNGKTGIDIRYYINPIWRTTEVVIEEGADEAISLDDFPD